MALRADAISTGTALIADAWDQFSGAPTHVWVTITSITTDPVSVFNILDGPPAIGDQFLWPLTTRAGNPTTLNPDGSFTVGPPTQSLDWIDGVEYYDSVGDAFSGPIDYSISDTLAIQIEPTDARSTSRSTVAGTEVVYTVTPVDARSASRSTTAQTATEGNVIATDSRSASRSTTADLTQTHTPAVQDSRSASRSTTATITTGAQVNPVDARSASRSTTATTEQTQTATPVDARSPGRSTVAQLVQTHTPAVQDSRSASRAATATVFVPARTIEGRRTKIVARDRRGRVVPYQPRSKIA